MKSYVAEQVSYRILILARCSCGKQAWILVAAPVFDPQLCTTVLFPSFFHSLLTTSKSKAGGATGCGLSNCSSRGDSARGYSAATRRECAGKMRQSNCVFLDLGFTGPIGSWHFWGKQALRGYAGTNGCFLVSITGCVAEETGSDQDFQKLTIPGRRVVLASLSLWHYDYDSYSAVGPKAHTCCASWGYFVV